MIQVKKERAAQFGLDKSKNKTLRTLLSRAKTWWHRFSGLLAQQRARSAGTLWLVQQSRPAYELTLQLVSGGRGVPWGASPASMK